MSDEANIPSSKPTGSIILDNPQVFALLRSTIDDRVAVYVRERNESLRKWLIGILTSVVVIFTGVGIVVLKSHVKEVVDRALRPAVAEVVDEAVGSAVAKVGDEFRFDSEIAALNFRMLRLGRVDELP